MPDLLSNFTKYVCLLWTKHKGDKKKSSSSSSMLFLLRNVAWNATNLPIVIKITLHSLPAIDGLPGVDSSLINPLKLLRPVSHY